MEYRNGISNEQGIKWKAMAKPLLLPLVRDIKKFRDEVTVMAEETMEKLYSDTADKKNVE